MHRVSGLTKVSDFAKRSLDLFRAKRRQPQTATVICEHSGFWRRLWSARALVKGFGGQYHGIDVDHELLASVGTTIPWVTPIPGVPRVPSPIGGSTV